MQGTHYYITKEKWSHVFFHIGWYEQEKHIVLNNSLVYLNLFNETMFILPYFNIVSVFPVSESTYSIFITVDIRRPLMWANTFFLVKGKTYLNI